MSLGELGGVLHHLGQSAEAEEPLRRSIRISKEVINAAPKLIYRRVIIAQALMTLAALERNKGLLDASKKFLADAQSHIRIGLEFNPRDIELNKLNVEDRIAGERERLRKANGGATLTRLTFNSAPAAFAALLGSTEHPTATTRRKEVNITRQPKP